MVDFSTQFMFPLDTWKTHNRKKSTRYKNDVAFINWMVYLTNLYLNAFEFQGLPDTVNERFLFETLYWDGKCLFFNDAEMGYLALPCAGEGGLNVYWEYTKYRAISNQYNKTYNYPDDCVLIRGNQLCYPPLFMLESWAARIADAERTIDVYAKTMKRPWLLTGEYDDKLTMKVLTDEIESNELVIAGSKRLSNELTRAYPNSTDGPGLLALWRHKHELLDECLTWMGINNANTEKRERLISQEVESNNQLIQLNKDTVLDWLKFACEEIGERFGITVTVDLKHDYIKEQMQQDAQMMKGGQNEQVHNNSGEHS